MLTVLDTFEMAERSITANTPVGSTWDLPGCAEGLGGSRAGVWCGFQCFGSFEFRLALQRPRLRELALGQGCRTEGRECLVARGLAAGRFRCGVMLCSGTGSILERVSAVLFSECVGGVVRLLDPAVLSPTRPPALSRCV